MLCITPQYTLQILETVAAIGKTTAGAVRKADDTVYIGVVAEHLGGEGGGNMLYGCCRAINTGEDRNIVSGACLAVCALIPHKTGSLRSFGWFCIVYTVFVVVLSGAELDIVSVDVIACGYVYAGVANELCVFNYLFAFGYGL